MIIRILVMMFLGTQMAYAQTAAELEAAQSTHVEGIRIIAGNSMLERAGIVLTYVERDTNPGGGRYSCGALSEAARNRAAEIARDAFARIGEEGLRRSKLKYVLLCSKATDSGRVIGGIPVPPINLLLLSTGTNEANRISPRLGKTALHEFYHYLEYASGSNAYPEWDKQFSGYDNSYGNQFPSTDIGGGGNHFINAYARTFPHEDRAELFAYIVYDTKAVIAFLNRHQDVEFASKVGAIVERCQKFLGASACR